MHDTILSLRRKINVASDLQSVVVTMKSLAASNISQFEESVRALDGYYQTLEMGLSACLNEVNSAKLTIEKAKENDDKIIIAVVFGSDQGLVGQFNEIVADLAIKTLTPLSGKIIVLSVGERVHSRLKGAELLLADLFTVPNSVKAISPLIGQILIASERNSNHRNISDLYLFYNKPISGAAYGSISKRLLPLDESWLQKLSEIPWPTNNLPELIEKENSTLRTFIREYLFASIYRACAQSLASENASRLAAMQRAEKNIEELLNHLNVAFHQKRKNDIDAELFDVISGFEAQIRPSHK